MKRNMYAVPILNAISALSKLLRAKGNNEADINTN